ncbi:MAG: FAD-dependent oxidoreductase [Clostridia bacterium]|nr:FAD-dependent oxidoreductase [Clostridia bacterium]
MESLWRATSKLPEFPRLEYDLKTDILIIGGGMAGLLCAYYLQQAGADYTLIEANRLCGGVTADTTAKITYQHGLIYDRLMGEFGAETARLYLEANRAALKEYARLAKTIDCDFARKDHAVYSDDRAALERELSALERIGTSAIFEEHPALPFATQGAVRVKDQAQFHPLKFAAAIAKGLHIYEHTAARAFDGEAILTDRGGIRARKIIVATHFPIFNKHGRYFLKLYHHRTYALALEGGPTLDAMYVGGGQDTVSLRNHGDLLLLGGGGHRTGKQGGNWAELEEFARKHYPKAKIRYRWAAQDCVSLDGIPYIGQYAKGTPDLYVATGFNKWGMTSSMVAARLLCDLTRGKKNPYRAVFDPTRSIWHKQLTTNALETTLHLLKPTAPRCPHLGCALEWNEQEHSWDCPCHGSRFAEDGKLLNDPATDDLKLKKKP